MRFPLLYGDWCPPKIPPRVYRFPIQIASVHRCDCADFGLSSFPFLDGSTEKRQVGLRIDVDEQHPFVLDSSEPAADMVSRGRLRDAALVVDERDDFAAAIGNAYQPVAKVPAAFVIPPDCVAPRSNMLSLGPCQAGASPLSVQRGVSPRAAIVFVRPTRGPTHGRWPWNRGGVDVVIVVRARTAFACATSPESRAQCRRLVRRVVVSSGTRGRPRPRRALSRWRA